MVLTNFNGAGVGFGFRVGCGFRIGWGFEELAIQWHLYSSREDTYKVSIIQKRSNLSISPEDSWLPIASILLWIAHIQDLAFDMSLSALLGDNIYNFGELFAHPIIKSLLGTQVECLCYILEAFSSGDLVHYQELCRLHEAALSSQPALVQNEKKLLEKINILCLMEIIFSHKWCRCFPYAAFDSRDK